VHASRRASSRISALRFVASAILERRASTQVVCRSRRFLAGSGHGPERKQRHGVGTLPPWRPGEITLRRADGITGGQNG
jgi:hypothetical protein